MAKHTKRKQPKTEKAVRKPSKSPRAPEEPGTLSQKVQFSFKLFDDYDLRKDKNQSPRECFRTIAGKLKHFNSLTWGDILKTKRSGPHPMPIDRFFDESYQRVLKKFNELRMEIPDNLFEFPLSGLERIWAHKMGSSAFILWWDPDHRVYLTQKRHT